jgi:hypothetical protein
MGIQCSHCEAMNPEDSMFCRECGWQIMLPEAEQEIEASIAIAQQKADPAALKPKRDVAPAIGVAGPEPEPAITRAEPETEPADLGAGADLEPAGREAGLDAELGAERAVLEAVPVVEPASSAAGPEAEPTFIEASSGSQPAAIDAGQDAAYEAAPETITSQEQAPYEDEAGVTITDTTAIVGDRIYAWSDIYAVSMETSPASRLPSLLLAAVGAIVLVLAAAGMKNNPPLGIVLIIGGLMLLAIGAVLVTTARDQYIVCVETASGAEAALVSPNREHVQRIVQDMRSARGGQDLPEQD